MAELRFLVDLVLPAEERDWARRQLKTPLAKLADTYSMIRYRNDRIEDGDYFWKGEHYRLEDILAEGGICVDQAYFASQAGKARGVPTLLFRGAGLDGRHAWFGFLGQGRHWVLDAGRFASQNLVTGLVYDPQTWLEITDHELAFLAEGFRKGKNAKEAQVHAAFARRLRGAGRLQEAEAAARRAARLERRCLEAWGELLALRPQASLAREAVAREAAGVLTGYPELQAEFWAVVIASMRERGETLAAERMGQELTRRFAERRRDLSVAEIAAQLARAGATQTVLEQQRLFRSLTRQFGRGGGADYWDKVARPFVEAQAKAGRWVEAKAALGLVREMLAPAYDSQLEKEVQALEREVAKRAREAAGGK